MLDTQLFVWRTHLYRVIKLCLWWCFGCTVRPVLSHHYAEEDFYTYELWLSGQNLSCFNKEADKCSFL